MEHLSNDQSQHENSHDNSKEDNPDQTMSKRELKKLQKSTYWKQKNEAIRQKRKEDGKNKKTVTSQTHIMRFNRDENGEPQKFSKQEKQKMFYELCQKGPRIIIDCDFEKLMLEKEIKSLTQQLGYATNANKQLTQPCNLIFTGVSGAIQSRLEKQNYEHWAVKSHKESYLEHYNKEDLVYLTADSDCQPLELDPAKIYIIGGIVDRNRYKFLTLNKAKEDGIAHARLPIGELMALRSSAVLAVNHVFEIVSLWFNSKDWKHALDKVIPERKQQSAKQAIVKVKELADQEESKE